MSSRIILYFVASVSLLFLLLATVILMRYLRPISLSRRLLYLSFPVSQIILLVFLLYYLIVYDLPLWLCVLTAFVSFLCGIGNFFLFKALRSAEEKYLAAERVRILENQMELQKEYLERLSADSEKTKETRSTLFLELQKIDESLLEENPLQAEQQVRQIAHRLACSHDHFCEHPIIDALMIMKSHTCESSGIDLSCNLSIPEDLSFSGVDLCAVFSNVMDNAIHACRKVVGGNTFIHLKTEVSGGYFLLKAKNSCALEPKISHFEPKSLSFNNQRNSQGWGLQILNEIAQRYEGTFHASRIDTVFHTSIMLKLDTLPAPLLTGKKDG